ncbi:PREDICTED: uncharacterized protein LOC107345726 [Acropora digitifera]|uniref:uncharacterized protein LOC107345726 n=1 Tax=Acropora digitifera TaxID=70779 RepID=UPI000779FB31|nr:PREDICTED: uncharacterized protein LOC107345726 [Acropora digitifera]
MKGIAYDAEETDMKKVVILVVGFLVGVAVCFFGVCVSPITTTLVKLPICCDLFLCAIFLADIVPFEVHGLLYHNIHRKLHKADDLQLDHHLSLDASSYARRLVVRHAPIQSRPGQGENIFLRCKAFSHGVSAFEAVKEWSKKGQMLLAGSTCTIKQLFAIFGASVRRGKQGFSVIL